MPKFGGRTQRQVFRRWLRVGSRIDAPFSLDMRKAGGLGRGVVFVALRRPICSSAAKPDVG
jgi:hypothetical protein